jgi:hypothetical protein
MTSHEKHKLLWNKMVELFTDEWLVENRFVINGIFFSGGLLDELKEQALYKLHIGFPRSRDNCFLCDAYGYFSRDVKCLKCPLDPMCSLDTSLYKKMLQSTTKEEFLSYMKQIATIGEDK